MLIGNNKYFMPLTLAPGAVGAYSLRRLRGDYTGPVVNVRRSNDNAVSDIGLSGRVLDISALTAFVGANNGFVATWYDQSGNAKHATNATAAEQPQIVSSGTVITDSGKPSVLFSGAQRLLPPSANHLQTNMLFGYCRNTATSGTTAALVFSGNNGFGIEDNGGMKWRIFGGSFQYDGAWDTAAKIFSALFSGASSTLHFNGILAIAANAGTNAASLQGIGGNTTSATSAPWNGYISEIIFYNSNMSTGRAAMENNINNFYNVY